MKLTPSQTNILKGMNELKKQITHYQDEGIVFLAGEKIQMKTFLKLRENVLIQARYTGSLPGQGRYVRYGLSPQAEMVFHQQKESAAEAKLREYGEKRRAKELRQAAKSDRWTDAELLKLAKKLLEEEV